MIKLVLKHLLVFLVVALPLTLIGILILPLVYLVLPKDYEHLPKFLRWFDNGDATMEGIPEAMVDDLYDQDIDGLVSPLRWRRPIDQGGVFPAYPILPYKYWPHWWARVRWTAFRNPINYFKRFKMDRVWTNKDYDSAKVTGDLRVTDGGAHGFIIPGSFLIKTDTGMFQYYFISKPIKNRCLRVNVGHKIWDPSERMLGDRVAWVCAAGLKKVNLDES
jgi:hypothetical protein